MQRGVEPTPCGAAFAREQIFFRHSAAWCRVAPAAIPRHIIHVLMTASFARFLGGFLLLSLPLGAQGPGNAPARLAAARTLADSVLATIHGAVAPAGFDPRSNEAERSSLGVNLADYATNPGTTPAEFENFIEAARRILAGEPATKQAPDATSAWLDDAATTILAAVRAQETATTAAPDTTLAAELTPLRARALIARYHARRALAAVHSNLFKRGLRLAELVAATYGERDAVVVWRELIATCGAHPLAPHWRAELKKLEWSLKELEDQCCPPDESILKETVWTPLGGTAARPR